MIKNGFRTNLFTLLALLIGVVCAAFKLPFVHEFSEIIIELFLNLLKFISLPMIFLAIVSTLTQMTNLKEVKFLLIKTLKYTLLTTLIAATLGLILFVVIDPANTSLKTSTPLSLPQGNYFTFLKTIIPENFLAPFLENNVLGMAFIAAILSFAILKIPKETSDPLKKIFQALFETFLKIASSLITLMPVAIFAFTIQFVTTLQNDLTKIKQISLYALCIILANLIQGFIVLPLFLKWKKLSPLKTVKAMLPALTMAFFTKSSNATLPLTLDCAKNRLKISEKTAKFSFPLCSIINMNGCAAFILITSLFVATSQGMSFTLFQMIPWIFISTIAAIGNAGVPMGCFFLTSLCLVGMNVPLELMGVILPIYALFDMIETALNVWSDCCITTVLDKDLAPSQ